MAKFRSSYVCQNCGVITQRRQGKCESCGEWNAIIEAAAALGVGGAAVRRGAAGRAFALEDLSGDSVGSLDVHLMLTDTYEVQAKRL